MKRLLYTFLALSFIFSSCKKEESNNSTNNSISVTNQNITGLWKVNSLYYNNIPVVAPDYNCMYFVLHSDSFAQLEFNNNCNNINLMFPDNYEKGDWILNGSNLILEFDTYDEITWEITSFNGTTANLDLVEYLNADDAPFQGSATIIKQ